MKIFGQFPLRFLDRLGEPVVQQLWPRQPQWAVASVSKMDAAFFAGLVIATKPRKLLEIGTASGWGSCILLQALENTGMSGSLLHSVDIAPRFFYDENYTTGQCVRDVMPAMLPNYRLTTGCTIAECAGAIGRDIDFTFIDAHHMHPWATLDLLSVLPYTLPNSWVAMHDLNLSRKEDQEHRNRGPKYLFEAWEEDKAHSIQVPPMAGAIKLGADPADHLPLLLDIVYTPWEIPIEDKVLDVLATAVSTCYGAEWGSRFNRAFEIGNYTIKKVHAPD